LKIVSVVCYEESTERKGRGIGRTVQNLRIRFKRKRKKGTLLWNDAWNSARVRDARERLLNTWKE